MRTLRIGRRELYWHTYTPVSAPRRAGVMLTNSDGAFTLSAGIRGWRGIALGWIDNNRLAALRAEVRACCQEEGTPCNE